MIESEQLKEVASNEEIFQLFGYYKQAMYGDCEMGRPSMADIRGVMKWQRWKDLVGLDQEEAKKIYTELVVEGLKNHRDSLK